MSGAASTAPARIRRCPDDLLSPGYLYHASTDLQVRGRELLVMRKGDVVSVATPSGSLHLSETDARNLLTMLRDALNVEVTA